MCRRKQKPPNKQSPTIARQPIDSCWPSTTPTSHSTPSQDSSVEHGTGLCRGLTRRSTPVRERHHSVRKGNSLRPASTFTRNPPADLTRPPPSACFTPRQTSDASHRKQLRVSSTRAARPL